MAKKSSVSSQREELVTVRAEDIFGKPLTKTQRARLAKLAKMRDEDIDTSDIPPLTDEQLAQFVPAAVARPGTTLVSLRVRNDVLGWLRSKGPGHLTRINAILAQVMEAERRVKAS